MLDFVFVAMILVVPILLGSVCLVKYGRNYYLHKWIQIALGAILLVAVVAFEVDVRLYTDWEALAEPSPYYQSGTWNPVWYALIVHLCFAIPTPLVWVYVIVQGVRRFPNPPVPGEHSAEHRRWGWIATIGMVLTSVTGWVYYWMAFVAS